MILKPALYALATIAALTAPAVGDDPPLNPAVTQATIETTICLPGWTKHARLSPRRAICLKMKLIHDEGLPEEAIVDFQLDHRIPIVLGGAVEDRRNFQLQDWEEASQKDATESCLGRAICAGRIELDDARRRIWKDWRHVGAGCDGEP